MHIVFVTRGLGRGGAERVITRLVNNWHNKGVRCSVVLTEHHERFYSLPMAVEIYELEEYSDNNTINKIKKYRELRRIIKSIKADTVMAMPEDIGVYTILALLGLKVPVYVSERNNPAKMPTGKLTRLLRTLLYPFAAGFIFQTNEASRYFPSYIRKRGIVLGNPLDLSELPAPYMGEREKVIVSAGRFEEQKNFPLLVEAFSKFILNHPDYTLRIYGDGKCKSDILDAMEMYGIQDKVELPGVSRQLGEDMKKCAMFVLSSDYEGMPNVLIEAMAVGLPVVSTECPSGGPAELIRNGYSGYLVPMGDSFAISRRMCDYAEKPETAAVFGQNAIDIRNRLNSEKICAKWYDFITEKVDVGMI